MHDYNGDLEIDEHALDIEWKGQSKLFMRYAELSAEAVYERDKAKDQLEVVKAEIDSDIRTNFKKFGFDKKPTEAALTAQILTNDKYKKYNDLYIKAIKNMNILIAAKDGIGNKKYALENLTKLWVAGYYSTPNISKEAKEQIKNVSEENIKEKVRQKLNRKRINK